MRSRRRGRLSELNRAAAAADEANAARALLLAEPVGFRRLTLLKAIAADIEHAYTGVERAFLVIAAEIDESVPLFCEYEAKLKHPEIMKRHGLSERDIDRLLNFVGDKAIRVSFHFRWRPQLRDPNDEMVLETAVNGGARWIVTFNVKDFQRAAPKFGVALLRPGPFVEMIRGATVKWDNTP